MLNLDAELAKKINSHMSTQIANEQEYLKLYITLSFQKLFP